MSGTKIYPIYPCRGSFSPNTTDYHGTTYRVAATSIRQAYAVAHKNVWINPADSHPVGIVSIYRRSGTTLWCGCPGQPVTGAQVHRCVTVPGSPRFARRSTLQRKGTS